MRIQHGRCALELHDLGGTGAAPPLLLLHALGGSARDWSEAAAGWPGQVCGLDFAGHGRSDALPGGGYTAELLAADADAALAVLGGAALAGAGIGAYAALLLAGARRDLVPAALLLPGRGLDGGGAQPNFEHSSLTPLTPADNPPLPPGCDPILCALEHDPRPPEYA
ncbi:MAG: alpha/beta fold hydrolase, partial [Candidatus Binatia bacterium]